MVKQYLKTNKQNQQTPNPLMMVFKDVNTEQTNGTDDVYCTALKCYLHWLEAPTMVRKKRLENILGTLFAVT